MTEFINLEFIKPNPFRNLFVKPYDETHIRNLAQSISLNGFTGSLPARQIDDKTYQIAYGHNRIQALRSLGIQQVPLDINSYTDREMVSILVDENALQSNNFLATLDSVQATIINFINDWNNLPIRLIKQIEKGNGIGHVAITTAQPRLKEKNVKICLSVFRETNLEKTFFPVELQPLYEKIPTTTIEAITLFSRPDHICSWVSGFKRYGKYIEIPISEHKAVAEEMLKTYEQQITASKITKYIKELAKQNTNVDEQKAGQSFDDLYKKVESFFKDNKQMLLDRAPILSDKEELLEKKEFFHYVSQFYPLFVFIPEILENKLKLHYGNMKLVEKNTNSESNVSCLAQPELNNNNADFIETEVKNYA